MQSIRLGIAIALQYAASGKRGQARHSIATAAQLYIFLNYKRMIHLSLILDELDEIHRAA